MRSDIDIKRDVEAELHSNPDIDATDIAVAVKNGVVALTGYVRSYMQKREAERAAKRVSGVVAVANDIEVRLPIFNQRPDPRNRSGRRHGDREPATLLVGPHPRRRKRRLGYTGRFGRVELPARAGRGGGTFHPWRQGRHQYHSASAADPARRDQTKDRGSLSSQRGSRCKPHNSRSGRRGGRPARHGAILGREGGGRTCRMGNAGCHQGGEPTHRLTVNCWSPILQSP